MNCAGFVFSTEGLAPHYYLIPLLYAVAATVPIALSRRPRTRVIAGLAVTALASASFVNLVSSAESFHGLTGEAAVADRIVAIAKAEHAPIGYADYWDASDLTWAKHMAILVAPAVRCLRPRSAVLCPFSENVRSTWYAPQSTRSFILRDTRSLYMSEKPPANLGSFLATYAINREFTMYIYPYDVSDRFNYSKAHWSR